MRPSYRPYIPPKPQPYRTLILDHLGLVAGMFEELGITEVIDKATQQDPEMRIVTAGHAVKAMVLNGLGFVNQQLYLVPHFFQNKPISRLSPEAFPRVVPVSPPLLHPAARVQHQGSRAAPRYALPRRAARVHTPGEACLPAGGGGSGRCAPEMPAQKCRLFSYPLRYPLRHIYLLEPETG